MTDPTPAPKKRRKSVKTKRVFTWRDHPTWKEKTRSERWLKEFGWTVDNVEYRLPGSFITKDAFSFGDLIAIREHCPILLVQSTSGPNSAAREKKIEACPAAVLWLRVGGSIMVHGWRGPSKGGKREGWVLRVTMATLNAHGAISWFVLQEEEDR